MTAARVIFRLLGASRSLGSRSFKHDSVGFAASLCKHPRQQLGFRVSFTP